jgi:hypothetical protein
VPREVRVVPRAVGAAYQPQGRRGRLRKPARCLAPAQRRQRAP